MVLTRGTRSQSGAGLRVHLSGLMNLVAILRQGHSLELLEDCVADFGWGGKLVTEEMF